METARVVKMLGGEKSLGAKIRSASDLIPIVRAGLQYRALESVIAGLGIARETILGAIGFCRYALLRAAKVKAACRRPNQIVFIGWCVSRLRQRWFWATSRKRG